MDWALNDVGYRLIDGAQAYENEGALGVLLSRRQGNAVSRDEVFVTSKVWPTDLGFVQTYQAILGSLNKVKSSYFDLYMIHWNRCNPRVSWMHCDRVGCLFSLNVQFMITRGKKQHLLMTRRLAGRGDRAGK